MKLQDASVENTVEARKVMADQLVDLCKEYLDGTNYSIPTVLTLIFQASFKVLVDHCGPAGVDYAVAVLDSVRAPENKPREFERAERKARDAFAKMAAHSDLICAAPSGGTH